MKVSEEYREANGLTPSKIADTMINWYKKVDALSEQIIARLASKGIQLKCRPGCCGCCRDELTMTQAEASVIRKLFPRIGDEKPHDAGACSFLSESGLCRIYEARPYICRTHGLPMRALMSIAEAAELGLEVESEGADEGEEIEMRDICEENGEEVDVMALPSECCLFDETAQAQLSAMNACAFGDSERIAMRAFFEN